MLSRVCERQVGVRRKFWLNAIVIPEIILCPHNAEPDSRFCHDHQEQSNEQDHRVRRP
jgi:hypothetical protein